MASVAVFALVACTDSPGAEDDPAQTVPISHIDVPPSQTTDERSIPDGAAPGAGGARPTEATEIRTGKSGPNGVDVAVFTLPAGAISCALTGTALRCGIDGYTADQPHGTADDGEPIDTVVIRDGDATLTARAGVSPWESMAFGADDTVVPQLVTYGETVYYGRFVCVNADESLTCWDTDSGAGAVISEQRTVLF